MKMNCFSRVQPFLAVFAPSLVAILASPLFAQPVYQGNYNQQTVYPHQSVYPPGYQQQSGYQQGFAQPGNFQPQQSQQNPVQLYSGLRNESGPVNNHIINGQLISGTNTSGYWTNNFVPAKRHHDFGAVPKGSKQEVLFEFENTLDVNVRLLGARASCGCTKPSVLTEVVKPGETARVLAEFDTFFKPGPKTATVTVSVQREPGQNQYGQTQYGEVQFSIAGKIRQDVVLNPGRIQFDGVAKATSAQRTVAVMYAGDPRWKILDVISTNPNLEIQSRETRRDATGRVDYELVVSLNDCQESGIFSDQLTLVTNDANSDGVNVNVEGHIKSTLQSSPVKLGTIGQDEQVIRKIILRGEEEFEISAVQAGDERIKFIDAARGKLSKLHILTFELDTTRPGLINCEITVESTIEGQAQAEIPFTANIVQRTAQNK